MSRVDSSDIESFWIGYKYLFILDFYSVASADYFVYKYIDIFPPKKNTLCWKDDFLMTCFSEYVNLL